MKLDWKIYSSAVGILILIVMVMFLGKIFFFFLIALVTILIAVILGFVQPVKYLGIELVTLSTILVGVVYGPVLGGVYGFTILLTHLVLGRYYMGSYLMWVIPEYILLGVLSGIFGAEITGYLGVSFIIGMNFLNVIFTFLVENERFVKELPYAIGNSAINSLLFLQFFSSIVNFID